MLCSDDHDDIEIMHLAVAERSAFQHDGDISVEFRTVRQQDTSFFSVTVSAIVKKYILQLKMKYISV